MARGQNVAQLVGLGYAVAASANLPALVLTLYWRRTTTQGVVIGIIGGTLAAIVLVLASPNMTYPALVRQEALATAKRIETQLQAAQDAGIRVTLLEQRSRALSTAQSIAPDATSIIGLREPLVTLRNPGILSIPVGFLLVILVSLMTRDAAARSRWAELVVRRETGLGAVTAIDH
ncbi:Na+(H+)/acetate symporter ActP [Paraburkholderia sp. GAS42]